MIVYVRVGIRAAKVDFEYCQVGFQLVIQPLAGCKPPNEEGQLPNIVK